MFKFVTSLKNQLRAMLFAKSSRRRSSAQTVAAQVQLLGDRLLLTTIIGDAGNNVLNGTSEDDIIDGREGNDTIHGLSGNDTLLGGEGNDFIRGGSGNEIQINGNQGDDLIYADAGDDALVQGGQGNDTIFGDNPEVPTVAGNDRLFGDLGNDQLFGGPGSDHIEGGDDNDFLYDDEPRTTGAAFGNDTLLGGNGSDNIISRGGNDVADGGAGIDFFQFDAPSDIVSNPAYLGNLTIQNFVIGQDQIILHSWANRGFGATRLYDNFSELLSKTEQVSGDVHIHLAVATSTGSGVSEVVDQYIVAKIILVGVNKSSLTPAMFVTSLGNDPGNPEHFGPQVDRRGQDLIGDPPNADSNRNQTILGAEGDDVINGRNGNDWIQGNTGNDHLFGDGGADTVRGGKGIDFVHGGDGNDILFGDNDLDFLFGGAGDDELYGDNPFTPNNPLDPRVDRNDTLRGGTESNRLEGGGGDDIFVIEPDSGTTDTITDLSRIVGPIETTNNDRIDLSAFTSIGSFGELRARAVQTGNDIQLNLPGKTVLIRNFSVDNLVPAMFIGGAGVEFRPDRHRSV